MEPPKLNHPRRPCRGCPFSRCVTPGALGGSSSDVYMGQIVGPFWLPCHAPSDYKGKQSRPDQAPQCAGAAIFRHKIKVSHAMPEFLLRLEDDPEDLVFTSVAEFYQHHDRLHPEAAKQKAHPLRVIGLLSREMSKTPVFKATLDGRVL